MKKLFVSDVDGTLVSELKPHLSSAVKAAIKLAVDNGDQFVLCSGRPTSNLIELSKELSNERINTSYVAGFNGVEIYDLSSEQLIVDNSLKAEEVGRIIEACDCLGLDYLFFDTNCIRTNIPDNYWTVRETEFYGQPASTEIISCKSQKVLLVVEPQHNYALQTKLSSMLPEFDIFESAPHFIEIVKKGINKASVVRQLQAIEGVLHEHTYGFGDSGNDVELLAYAHKGVALANGNDKAKAVADIVIGHVDDYAVADFITSVYE